MVSISRQHLLSNVDLYRQYYRIESEWASQMNETGDNDDSDASVEDILLPPPHQSKPEFRLSRVLLRNLSRSGPGTSFGTIVTLSSPVVAA